MLRRLRCVLGFLEHGQDVDGYLANQKAMLPIFEWLSTLLALERLLRWPFISRRIMPKKTDKTGVGLLLAFAETAIAERRRIQHRDMLGSFLQHGIEAKQEVVLQIMVGSDTTATAMHMALFFAMTNPRVWGCLHCEIQKEEQSGLSTPVSASQCQQMPYLDACVKATLRLWPPVVGLNGKVVPPGGT